MSKYSRIPLSQKLGIKDEYIILHPPKDYLTKTITLSSSIKVGYTLIPNTAFVHFFTTEKTKLQEFFSTVMSILTKNGTLWISWPKKNSGVPCDLDENIIREIGIENGMVDVKVCAVDDIWSGLKFVFRKKDR